MCSLFMKTGAKFSEDRVYRYALWRTWGDGPIVNFVMLNPSTADEVENDPTIERCERRARDWGHGGLIVTNLFAIRATDPVLMKKAGDPIGPENDLYLDETARTAALVVCAWGTHGKHLGRGEKVRRRLSAFVPLHALSLTKDGQPGHPLYLPYSLKPMAWPAPDPQPERSTR